MSGTVRHWWVEGLAKGLSSVVIGWIIAALISLGLMLNIGWVREVETRGIGLSMRMAISFFGPISVRATDPSHRTDPILFLDVDEAACERFAANPARCRIEGVADPAVLNALGLAMRESRAKAVVLDLRLPLDGKPGEVEALASTWGDGEGAPVFAPLPAVPTAQGALQVDWAAAAPYRRGRMQLFPAVGGSLNEIPSVLSRVPREVTLVPAGQQDGPGRLPSLAVAVGRAKHGSTPSAAGDQGYSGVFLTLPPLAVPRAVDYAGDYIGDYERRSLSDFLQQCDGCPPTFRTGDWSGWTVVIGSSAPAAQDLHETLIGPMPGAEFLANAIRAEDLGAYPMTNKESGLLEKIAGTLPAALLSICSWLAISWLWRGASKRAAWKKVVLSLLVYTSALSLALAMNVWQTMSAMLDGPSATGPADLLFPTLAIFLEGLIDGLSHVTRAVETAVFATIARLMRRPVGETISSDN